jgi:hypothetical protein
MANIQRAWKILRDPFVNQGGRIVVETHAGLPAEPLLRIQRRLAAGEFSVTVDQVTDEVEDVDRNVVTEPDGTYQVIGNGNEFYLIQTS